MKWKCPECARTKDVGDEYIIVYCPGCLCEMERELEVNYAQEV